MGIVGTYAKENEYRKAILPSHIKLIPEELRQKMTFEKGYGDSFGMKDAELAELTSGKVLERDELYEKDILLLPKPLAEDLQKMKTAGVLWGWPHFVQQYDITQAAIDNKLTGITWEGMFEWRSEVRGMHTFQYNNEMAGYCGVQHALNINGMDGFYGEGMRAVVISFGAVGRGAVRALLSRGYNDVWVYTGRPPSAVTDKIMGGVEYRQMKIDENGRALSVNPDGTTQSLIEVLSEAGVIVNATLQNPLKPRMFVQAGEEDKLQHGTLIVDVSCDEDMAFPFAKPTTFASPMFKVEIESGELLYYAVDHTPSYLWRAASAQISAALLPFIPVVMKGPAVWDENVTIHKAIEVRDGKIINPDILEFQNRESDYPHNRS